MPGVRRGYDAALCSQISTDMAPRFLPEGQVSNFRRGIYAELNYAAGLTRKVDLLRVLRHRRYRRLARLSVPPRVRL